MFKTQPPKPEPVQRMGASAPHLLPLAGTKAERREAISKMFPALPSGKKPD